MLHTTALDACSVFRLHGRTDENLAPTLLLIPAMSEETADFELLAKRLAHDPQGFTLVACAGSKANAIFGRPSLKSSVITARSASAGCAIFTPEGQIRMVK